MTDPPKPRGRTINEIVLANWRKVARRLVRPPRPGTVVGGRRTGRKPPP